MSVGGCYFSKAAQDPLVMAVALLGDMLQNLPELHTDGHRLSTSPPPVHARRVPTMFSLMSSLCVIWMSVWNSLP